MYSKKCNINFQKSSISLYKYGIIKENNGEKMLKTAVYQKTKNRFGFLVYLCVNRLCFALE
ncbi:hypothetical protein HMPREF0491_00045 [Lachnospiraceae oral taxon 107 str. F0167]|nr:hypothetical protein HMPREF0491_00045 [Lachnospiraceae oral taxon 107 str. F0167]